MKTGTDTIRSRRLRDQTIQPFTDLLLHDMGPALADNFAEVAGAAAAMWRTPALWGIGYTERRSRGRSREGRLICRTAAPAP